MAGERRMLELYLKQAKEEPDLEHFLDFVYGVLFSAYVKKTAVETKKTYCMKEGGQREKLLYLEDAEFESKAAAGGTAQDDEEMILNRLVLHEALNALPQKQKAVLWDFFLKEKDEKRIAFERGISRQAVNGLKRRGLAALRQEMELVRNENEEGKIMTAPGIILKHWPTDNKRLETMIASPFGMRVHPVTKERKVHQGVDIRPMRGAGEPVYAACAGTVYAAKANRDNPVTGYGWYVVVNHGGWCTLYAHLAEKPAVTARQEVGAGQILGKLGSTGASTGPHLHFGVARGVFRGAASEWIDPGPLLGALKAL